MGCGGKIAEYTDKYLIGKFYIIHEAGTTSVVVGTVTTGSYVSDVNMVSKMSRREYLLDCCHLKIFNFNLSTLCRRNGQGEKIREKQGGEEDQFYFS